MIKIRKVKINDIDNIYNLSNNIDVRKNSFNDSFIEYKDHKEWFNKKINDKDCIFLIIEDNSNFIAQVRFEITDIEAFISISIVEGYRNKGLGKEIMNMSLNYIKNNTENVKKIKAYIRIENIQSIKFFEKCNFNFVKKIKINNKEALEYCYEF